MGNSAEDAIWQTTPEGWTCCGRMPQEQETGEKMEMPKERYGHRLLIQVLVKGGGIIIIGIRKSMGNVAWRFGRVS